jgi:hypothetical protein
MLGAKFFKPLDMPQKCHICHIDFWGKCSMMSHYDSEAWNAQMNSIHRVLFVSFNDILRWSLDSNSNVRNGDPLPLLRYPFHPSAERFRSYW